LKQKTNLNLVLRLSKRVDLVPCFRIERRWLFRMNLGLFYLQIIDRAIHLCKQCRWSTKDLKRTHRTHRTHRSLWGLNWLNILHSVIDDQMPGYRYQVPIPSGYSWSRRILTNGAME
jgi:hypothetical protein